MTASCAQESGQLEARKVMPLPAPTSKEALCDESVSDGNEFRQGIIGGRSLKAGNIFSQSTVMVLSRKNLKAAENKVSLCTGLLITNDVVLTAAHCISDQVQNMQVIFSNNVACKEKISPENTRATSVLRTAKHESFSKDLPPDQKYDLALVQIKGLRPNGYRPLKPVSVLSVRSRDQLVQVGYGVTSFVKGGEGRLRIVGKKGSQLTRVAADSPLFFMEQQSSGVCSGDSGGPLLRVTDKGLELIGVATSVAFDQQAADPCRGNGVYLDINPFLPWIDETLQSFRSSQSAK